MNLRVRNNLKFVYKVYKLLSVSLLILLVSGCEKAESENTSTKNTLYTLETVDPDGPRSPWGKTTGDINGDGLIDLVVGGHSPRKLTFFEKIKQKLGIFECNCYGGELIWYQNPNWQRHLITEDFRIRTDLEVADIDRDGNNDVVILADKGIYWLENPSWKKHYISSNKTHDIELADLDRDGDIDIVTRNQSLFGYQDGNHVDIYRQDEENEWFYFSIFVPHGEGLKLSDMNNDGYLDIVVNQQWLENPGKLSSNADWKRINYSVDWLWEDVFIDTADFNDDGVTDIVLSPSEDTEDYYQIAWFEAPEHAGDTWKKHIIDPLVETIHHFVAARDVDQDGDLDVITAEMNQGKNPDEVKIYLNNEDKSWSKHVLGTHGSHSMRALDIDGDSDIDIFGANWQIRDYDGKYPVQLWRNNMPAKISWVRHQIDDNRPGQATFIYSSDIDGDDKKDIITGAYWYKQPSSLNGMWQRIKLGDKANNIALVADFDGDSDKDILASGWHGYGHKPSLIDRILNRLGIKKYDYRPTGNKFVWGQNDGSGYFEIHNNIEEAKGDFLQGASLLRNTADESTRVILSWHRTGQGVQSLTIPENPENQIWRWELLHSASQDEQLNVGDVDTDGLNDILMGTKWLRNSGTEKWQLKIITALNGEPDRNRLVDFNKDGLPDVLIGYQAIDKPGKLAWYQQPTDGEDQWQEHLVAIIIGPMSLSTADLDNDNDWDIVVGEHNLSAPDKSRLFWYENSDGSANEWKKHLIYQGDEHHNGALTVDIDNDGDMDIASIGWTHGKVIIYENQLE